MKSKIVLFIVGIFLLNSCNNTDLYIINEGRIYGTDYKIAYQSPGSKDLHSEIINELNKYNLSFSTFEKNSVISKINNNEDVESNQYFLNCFNRAQEISEITDGAFDITVMPMVNAWGFGFKNKQNISESLIDSLKAITGYHKVRNENGRIIKDNPGTMLDMSAIAKGYTSDLIGDFLASKGCVNYMVEIGGEVVAKGINNKGKLWLIGIEKPIDDNIFSIQELKTAVRLNNKAMATSGNYRNFYVEDGVKYAHTIDPKTGYPVKHSLLSATVLADDCATADAFATSFMVMGLEKGKELANQIPEIDVYFIYSDENGTEQVYYSDIFKEILVD